MAVKDASERPIWGVVRALGVSWGAIAMANALTLAVLLPAPAPGMRVVRLAHHAYDAGHLLLLGVATSAASWLWCRFAPNRRWLAGVTLWLVCASLALLVLRNDLDNLLRGRRLLFSALCALAGLAPPLAWALARVLARAQLRWFPILAGIALTVANHVVLAFNYHGLHLLAVGVAAPSVAGGLATLRRRNVQASPRRRLVERVGAVGAVVLAAASLLVTPSRAVWREMFTSPGTVLAPYLARLLPERRNEQRPLLIEASPWYYDRARALAVPPSGHRVVSPDAVTIFLTVDALRRDVVPMHAKELPALNRVRLEAVEFAQARAPSPSTTTTLVSVFTGKYYSSLYWAPLDGATIPKELEGTLMPLEDSSPRVPALLDAAGIRSFHVATLVANGKAVGGPGVGFTEESSTKTDYGPADEAMTILLDRLSQHASGPLFTHLHLVEPHAPYNLAGTDGTDYECYLREVQLVDRAVERLLDFLDRHPLGKRTVLVLSADHGEAFGEHGSKYHGLTAYEELVRVPLYVRVPGVAHRVISEAVGLMDMGPTFLDLYGLPTPGHFMGESLLPFLHGENPLLERPLAIDAARRIQALYFPDGKKVIVNIPNHTQELYDLRQDPSESRNLIDEKDSNARWYLGALQTFFEEHRLKRPHYQTPWRPF